MNRDWFALSQPETRGRIDLGLRFFPQVAVDEHEMGGDATYYFAPPAAPENPHITPTQHDWLVTFGRDIAARFDERGFAYFTREIFDSFYPGYGESWPMFHGAIGMTFEQASPRGLVWQRDDGDLLTYREAVVITTSAPTLHRGHPSRAAARLPRSGRSPRASGPVRASCCPASPPWRRARRNLAGEQRCVTPTKPFRVGTAPCPPARSGIGGATSGPGAQPVRATFRGRGVRAEQDCRRAKPAGAVLRLTGWSLPRWDAEASPPAVRDGDGSVAAAGASHPRWRDPLLLPSATTRAAGALQAGVRVAAAAGPAPSAARTRRPGPR
jgi:hypothetical protein